MDEAAKARQAAQPSRVQRTKQARRSRGSGLSFARARRRPKQKQGTATRSSAPVFASIILDAQQKSAKRKRHEQRPLPVAETGSCEWRSAPVFASIILDAQQKSAKRKRAYVTASTASMCFTVLRSARSSVAPLGQRGREGVSIPPPYPLWTPYPPLNDQGMSPWTQMRKVAPGVWLKKLFTARQRYCASLFPGAIRPALRLCMRALRARLPNVPNEINDFNGFTIPLRKARNQRNHDSTVSPEIHETNDFNEITIPRYPNGITKTTKPTKTTKCLFCGHFVFFVGDG